MAFFRSCVFNAYFVLLTIVMGIGAIPVRLTGSRERALRYAQAWTAATIAGLHHICGIELELIGTENLPEDAPCLIASQHQSAFDTLVWMNLVPRPAYVMKKELTKVPLVGPMLLLSGMIPVERLAGASALRGLLRGTEAAIADRRQIIVFPEGTRTRPGERVPLQPGIVAMARHAPIVVPVATNSGLFWGRNAFVKRPGRLAIVIGQPIEGASRAVLIAALQGAWDSLSQAHNLVPSQSRPVDNSVGTPAEDRVNSGGSL
ncbi:lysophospholipid acyltransferase family protein [Tanticharoenia sakaeratensis]|uniref:Acetyl transferase n=1 Tax=Tanticharoenia sakaeratensis NBRC 103193 TaxID=1231623 RepID=A0A0D6MKB0_9PROT|nr:lysophospholipid acyltransferase family protein [Tanticharoenia sakaeratensis]GAN53713.1 acetyl transferase [Tanticharoenia sakaeratensis NBRC 103193]GBQ17114.1 1-acyl-sn-glycerol-3-phosphate acyltransferase [Tanticharoenia sakaeratensis NBRC 103193]